MLHEEVFDRCTQSIERVEPFVVLLLLQFTDLVAIECDVRVGLLSHVDHYTFTVVERPVEHLEAIKHHMEMVGWRFRVACLDMFNDSELFPHEREHGLAEHLIIWSLELSASDQGDCLVADNQDEGVACVGHELVTESLALGLQGLDLGLHCLSILLRQFWLGTSLAGTPCSSGCSQSFLSCNGLLEPLH